MEINFINNMIIEMDLKAANASILFSKGYIDEEMYTDLIEGDKTTRNIIIGKLKFIDDNILDEINSNIKNYTDMFISDNNIHPSNILEIAKDAIFLIDKKLKIKKLVFDEYISFVRKNVYSCYLDIKIDNKVCKMYLDNTSGKLTTRFSKINKEHEASKYIEDLIRYKRDNNKRSYTLTLKKLIKFEETDSIINGFNNKELISAFKELITL